ncbi:MAG: cation diffusion facilitator family transporter [Gemmatimonadaceae bacterium]|nr:cation diffusion facilitator family transporter [Gemmatimonadaceae bacterium]
MRNEFDRGVRTAQLGMITNAALALVKLLAGVFGNSYALIADAVESSADIFSSLIVWGGLRIASRDPDDDYPFGYGKAEAVASFTVALMLLGAAVGIAVEAIREIITPHHSPAPWTLIVLVTVVIVKALLARKVAAVGEAVGSTAVQADAWHHQSDAITSAAAFVGISIAVWKGPGWEAADDWAALIASVVIAYNGVAMLRTSLRDLMDRHPGEDITAPVRRVAEGVPGVAAIEKLLVRRSGIAFHVEIHVQADPTMSLADSHALGGLVKSMIREAQPRVRGVLVHMEPFVGQLREGRR